MLLQGAPVRVCDINIGGLLGLLEAARIHRLERVVWFSSILAYGDRPDLTASMEEITELFDYEKIAALESKFSVEEDLERKYRDKERSYVVRTGTKQ